MLGLHSNYGRAKDIPRVCQSECVCVRVQARMSLNVCVCVSTIACVCKRAREREFYLKERELAVDDFCAIIGGSVSTWFDNGRSLPTIDVFCSVQLQLEKPYLDRVRNLLSLTLSHTPTHAHAHPHTLTHTHIHTRSNQASRSDTASVFCSKADSL